MSVVDPNFVMDGQIEVKVAFSESAHQITFGEQVWYLSCKNILLIMTQLCVAHEKVFHSGSPDNNHFPHIVL